MLRSYFPTLDLDASYQSVIDPTAKGESLGQLHNRFAYALDRMIADLDHSSDHPSSSNEATSPKAALVCTHAAGMICVGRALTGRMPDDPDEEDFGCGTCAMSVFVRRKSIPHANNTEHTLQNAEDKLWDSESPAEVPDVGWRGCGVRGGWNCMKNGDCTFLIGGEERSW